MSLILCPECNNEISEFAKKCPHCGCPSKMWSIGSCTNTDAMVAGQYLKLGKWGSRALEWRVLTVDDKKALLISEVTVDFQPFDAEEKDKHSWENSELKRWLEVSFASRAFEPEERARISEITCLSAEEAEQFFRDDTDRRCPPSGYITLKYPLDSGRTETSEWWLRSIRQAGNGEMFPTYVSFFGHIQSFNYFDGKYSINGIEIDSGHSYYSGPNFTDKRAVRPAIWISI